MAARRREAAERCRGGPSPGGEGVARQRELEGTARRGEVRVVGHGEVGIIRAGLGGSWADTFFCFIVDRSYIG